MKKENQKLLQWLALGVVLIGSFLFVMFANQGGTASDTTAIEDGEWARGNLDSQIVLVEYSDFQCPACKSRESILNPLVEEFGDHVKFVYRNFPLRSIHQNAQLSAQAGEAAGIQGKFWEMHDQLFATQEQWEKLSNGDAKKFFINLAQQIDLDTETFESDMNSSTVRNEVNDDYDLAVSLGLSGTPTFFLNGEQINLTSYEQGRQTLRDAISNADAK